VAKLDSSELKIRRAEKHYLELLCLFQKQKPFRYFLETNCKTGERCTFAKRDDGVSDSAAIIIGDIIHNLRAALDHAYWQCTEKHSKSDGERKKIQFPIISTEKAFRESELPGLPSRVSISFVKALESLKPYRENGNKLLCAIHDLDVLDKHKLLVPTGNFTKITSAMLQEQVPDFPAGIINCSFGSCYRDVVWKIKPMTWTERRKAKIPCSNIIERELDVPVEIVLSEIDSFRPALEVLQDLISLTRDAVKILYDGAKADVPRAL
jgi:hypothetical protein